MNPHKNVAARSGRWSAQHRRTAILVAVLIDATSCPPCAAGHDEAPGRPANWYLPKRLRWLPKLEHEAAGEPARAWPRAHPEVS